MTYSGKIYKKANIQSVCEYWLDDQNEEIYEYENIEERLERVYQECKDIANRYDERGTESELFSALINILTDYEHIYMELGVRTGILFMKDILFMERT